MCDSDSHVPFRDISMLLRDPYALNVVCHSIIACLHDTQKQWKLPRVSYNLHYDTHCCDLLWAPLGEQ